MPTVASSRAPIDLEINAAIRFLRWRIRASLLNHATTFEADVAGARIYRQASEDDRVTLEQGFVDDAGNPQTLGQLKDGVIDVYVHDRQRRRSVVHLEGRDAAALLIDREFTKRYVRFPGAPLQAGSTDVPTVIGIFMASTIAQEVCASQGLSLAWQTRDYELWEDFDANGRCIDILESLIAPWNVADPNRTDIFTEGNVVYIRKRTAMPLEADYSYSVATGRIQHVTLRKKRLTEFGQLVLRGRTQLPSGGSATFDPGPNKSGVVTGTYETIDPQVTVTPDGGKVISSGTQTQVSVSRQYGLDGEIVGLTIEIVKYRTPDQLILYSYKETYLKAADGPGLELNLIEIHENGWEPSLYDDRGALNQPLYYFSDVIRLGWTEVSDPEGNTVRVFTVISLATIDYLWDYDRHLRGIYNYTAVDVAGVLTPLAFVVETLADAGPLMVWRRIERYQWDTIDVEEQAPDDGGGGGDGGDGEGGGP